MLQIRPTSEGAPSQAVVPASQYARDRDALVAVLTEMADRIDSTRQIADAARLEADHAHAAFGLSRQENQQLIAQIGARDEQIANLAQRVDAVSEQNGALRQQLDGTQERMNAMERQNLLERQGLQGNLNRAQGAAEKAQLQARMSELRTELAGLDQEKAGAGTFFSGMSGFTGAFWGAVVAGLPGAFVGAIAGAPAGNEVGKNHAAETQTAKRSAIEAEIRELEIRLRAL